MRNQRSLQSPRRRHLVVSFAVAALLSLLASSSVSAALTSPSGTRGYERVLPADRDPYTAAVTHVTADGRVFWRTNGSPADVEPDGGSALSGFDALASDRTAGGYGSFTGRGSYTEGTTGERSPRVTPHFHFHSHSHSLTFPLGPLI